MGKPSWGSNVGWKEREVMLEVVMRSRTHLAVLLGSDRALGLGRPVPHLPNPAVAHPLLLTGAALQKCSGYIPSIRDLLSATLSTDIHLFSQILHFIEAANTRIVYTSSFSRTHSDVGSSETLTPL